MPFIIITSLVALTFIFFPECPNRMFFQSSIGLGLIALSLSYRLKKIHWSASLLSFVSTLSAVLMTNYPAIYKKDVPLNVLFSLESNALLAYFIIVLFGAIPFFLNQEYFRKLIIVLFCSAVVNSAFMIIKTIIYGMDHCFAMMSNSAVDASFIACMLPLPIHMIYEKKYKIQGIVSLIFMIVAIVLSKSSTGIATIGIVFSAYWTMKYGILALKKILPLGAMILLSSHFYLKNELLNPNGRFHIWSLAMGFYWKMTHLFLGSGVGTFFIWGPEIEKSERVHQLLATGLSLDKSWQQLNLEISSNKFSMFTWLHNEPLQVLFEMGIIGLASLIVLYYFLIVKSWKKKNALFPMVIAYGFISLTQMTLRYFVLQLLGACLIMCVFNESEKLKNN